MNTMTLQGQESFPIIQSANLGLSMVHMTCVFALQGLEHGLYGVAVRITCRNVGIYIIYIQGLEYERCEKGPQSLKQDLMSSNSQLV